MERDSQIHHLSNIEQNCRALREHMEPNNPRQIDEAELAKIKAALIVHVDAIRPELEAP
jgi:hypothetical protein